MTAGQGSAGSFGPPPDPRCNPWRPDLAAESLRGRVGAARFVAGVDHRITSGVAGLHTTPDGAAPLGSQLLYGECFTVYETRDGWGWGQGRTDGYVGWVRQGALSLSAPGPDGRPSVTPPTHRISALRAFLQPAPGLKYPPLDLLSFHSPLRVIGQEDGYAALDSGGWISLRQLMPAGSLVPDFVATALRFLGTPYLWGGRSSLGIDCSGLVQTALAAAGIPAPRDSDQQRATTGEPAVMPSGDPVPPEGTGFSFRRGDIVFFPGHVGLMLDETRLVHATAHAMETVIEPLSSVTQRTDPTRGGGILAVRRIPTAPR